MTIRETIVFFQQKIQQHLEQLDVFLDNWDKTAPYQRCLQLDTMLHEMWLIYVDAENIEPYIKTHFPPYPFEEVRTIKKWIKNSQSSLDEFLQTYIPNDVSEPIDNYNQFLAKICDERDNQVFWHSRDKETLYREKQLLEMLNRSYSVLLELLMATQQSARRSKETTITAYHNAEERYRQLTWTKDRKSIDLRIESKYTWENLPSSQQLRSDYDALHNEYVQSRLGNLRITHPDEEDFIITIARLNLEENELTDFFRYQCSLNYYRDLIAQRKLDETAANCVRKFSYIKSDIPSDIREIESTILIHIRAGHATELLHYFFDNPDLFLKMPVRATSLYSEIDEYWKSENKITPKSFTTAWNRLKEIKE